MKQVKHIFYLTVMLIVVFNITACGISSDVDMAPDSHLITFLPAHTENYAGDSDYYHVTKNIETENNDDKAIALISGEVRDNSKTKSTKDYSFEVRITVDHEKMVQTYRGTQLNESVFSEIVLLKRPIEVGNQWSFSTVDQTGEKVKVNAEIMSVESEGDIVTVRYSTKDGYYEERTLVKGRGTTDFTRMVIFKNERSITGYHSEIGVSASVETPQQPTEAATESLPLTEVKIPVAVFNLILGFDQAWSDYVKQESDDLLKFVSADSPAMEKIKAVTRDAATAIEFVKFYPYDVSTDNYYTYVKVVETFLTLEDDETSNRVQYKIVEENGLFKIYDFEIEK